MSESARRIEFLKKVEIFIDLSPEELEQLTAHLDINDLPEGTQLFCEGDDGNELYILESGRLGASVELADGEHLDLAEFGPGDFFGEMSIIEREPRSATCYTKAKSRLLTLKDSDFYTLMERKPETVSKILARMLGTTRKRLENTSGFLTDMVRWGESARRRAITDDLTGLYNRRYLDEVFPDLFERARARGEPFAFIMLDLDRFRAINEQYSEEVGDRVIQVAAGVFKQVLRETDIAVRYGGDEFTILLPGTNQTKALELAWEICRRVREVDILKKMAGAIDMVTTSQGLACFPDHAKDIKTLRDAADAALYSAKEKGRDCVEPARIDVIREKKVIKTAIPTIYRKNQIVSNIIDALDKRKSFLLIGHKNPDEDCIASIVSFALLITKFEKEATVCIGKKVHEHYEYLLNICRHNSIHIAEEKSDLESQIDTIVICDTPKPSMVAASTKIKKMIEDPSIKTIEIDHHLDADSAYSGDADLALVDEASSACELVGLIALKMRNREDLLTKYNITDLFSRNLVLSILTGIIGDSKMGKYLKTKREHKFYEIFSGMFNELLARITTNLNNFSNKEEVFSELGRLSANESECLQYLLERSKISDSIGYVVLDPKESESLHQRFTIDTIVSVSRSVADVLAEKSGYLSLIVYYDDPGESDLIQFRMRRSHTFKVYDLRKILSLFSIENGGGHEGAIGFRLNKNEMSDITEYTINFIKGIEEDISELREA